MRSLFVIISSLLVVAVQAQSEYKNVKLPENKDFSFFSPSEPSIAVSLTNPKEMVAGSILNNVYKSHDGGNTWDVATLKSTFGVYGDPAIIASPTGDFFFLHLADPEQGGWNSAHLLDNIVIQQLKEKEVKCTSNCWTNGVALGSHFPKDQDKQWACTSRDGKYVYVTWTEFDKYESKSKKHRSRILFSSWNIETSEISAPVRLSDVEGGCLDDDNTVEGAVPAIGLNGEIYVTWAHKDKIYFNVSVDNGKTWLKKSRVIMHMPGGWNQEVRDVYRANGMPVLMSDWKSGSLYLCWSDTRNGNIDVFCSTSKDGGNTWGSPVRVNNDQTTREQFFPWLAVDQSTGNLYAVFYDRRNYEDARTDVYMATSIDGGQTWKNERISESPFITQSTGFLGDYNNISASQGTVRPIWTRMDNGTTSVWTAIIQK